jgi:hypothetical protein
MTTIATKTTAARWILPFTGVLTGFLIVQLANIGFPPLVSL